MGEALADPTFPGRPGGQQIRETMIHSATGLQPDEQQSGPFKVHGLVHW